jgi:hypothetical protein
MKEQWGENNKCDDLCKSSSGQGCQIFSWHNIPKRENGYPKEHNINLPEGQKYPKLYIFLIYPTALRYTNVFHSNTFQKIPKLGFWVREYTIWQPWFRAPKVSSSDSGSEPNDFRYLNQCMQALQSCPGGGAKWSLRPLPAQKFMGSNPRQILRC